MLIFGTSNLLSSLADEGYSDIKVYSLCPLFRTTNPTVIDASVLNPFMQGLDIRTIVFGLDFDCWYANYVTNCPGPYKMFLDIMRDVRNGDTVYIISDNVTYIDLQFGYNELIESLYKFLIERYGLFANVVQTEEDLTNLTETQFSTKGLLLLDRELEHYLRIFGSRDLPSVE